MARLDGVVRVLAALLFLHCLGGVEQGAIDDRELGRLDDDPVGRIVGAADALAGFGVLEKALPIPDDFARIQPVLDDAVEALAAAVDGRGVPVAAARRRDALGVQFLGDLARRFAGDGVVAEDSLHDRLFALVDADDARLAGHRVIAVGAAAGDLAFAHASRLAAASLLGEVDEEHLAQQALDAGMHGRHLTVDDGVKADFQKLQIVAQGVGVGLAARNAVHVLGDDGVEFVTTSGAHECAEAEAVDGGSARDGLVFEGGDDVEALPRRPRPAEVDLIGTGAFVLLVG